MSHRRADEAQGRSHSGPRLCCRHWRVVVHWHQARRSTVGVRLCGHTTDTYVERLAQSRFGQGRASCEGQRNTPEAPLLGHECSEGGGCSHRFFGFPSLLTVSSSPSWLDKIVFQMGLQPLVQSTTKLAMLNVPIYEQAYGFGSMEFSWWSCCGTGSHVPLPSQR